MTIEEYDDLRLELAQGGVVRLPESCTCTNCGAVLATLDRSDVLVCIVNRKLSGKPVSPNPHTEYNCGLQFSIFLDWVVDHQNSLTKTVV